jgi:hypothetical protein
MYSTDTRLERSLTKLYVSGKNLSFTIKILCGYLIIEGLFKNVQMQGAQKDAPRGVYRETLSGAFCSATQQTMVPFRV